MPTMISYSRNDWTRVKPVVSFLKAKRLPVWLDREKIEPEMDWRRELLRAPREIEAFIPFLSKSYIESEMCRMELFLARSSDRPIFPVMLEECWALLDSKEETKYLAGIFAARLEALKIVGLHATRRVILARLLRAIQNRIEKVPARDHNVYISYPGAAEVAMKLYLTLSDDKIRPWIATEHCEIGDDWRKVQVQAMTKAKAHLVVVTDDFLNEKDVLRTEVLMSEALELPTLCVMAPNLVAQEEVHKRVYKHISSGDQAFRRLVQYQWYEPKHIKQKLRLRILEILGAGQP